MKETDPARREDEAAILDTPAAGSLAIRGGAIRLLTYVVGVGATVASAALLFRHLGVEDSGRYVLVLSLVTLTAGITDAGLSTLGVRELALRRGEDRHHFIRNLLGLRAAFGLVGALAACAYAVIAGFGSTLVLGTAIAGLGVVIQNLQGTLATWLQAELRLGWVAIADLLRQLVTVLGIVVLVLLGASLLPFFVIGVIAGAAALVMTAVLVRRAMPFAPAFESRRWAELLRDTLPFALAVAVAALYFRLAILLVDLVSNSTQTGYFGVSFRIVEVLIVIPQLVIGAGFPIVARAARDDADRLQYGLQRMVEASLLLGTLIAVGLGVGAPVAIDLVAGGEFEPAVPVLQWHSLALVFSFAAAVFSYGLLSLRRHRAILAMTTAALLTSVTGVLLLGSLEGATGAAAATAAAELVLAVSGWLLLARGEGGLRLDLRPIPRLALAAALAVVPAFLLPAWLAAVAALLIFGAAALGLGVVPDELLVEARSGVRRIRRV
jgi:O-antigen/teichoic acid export membrane protein